MLKFQISIINHKDSVCSNLKNNLKTILFYRIFRRFLTKTKLIQISSNNSRSKLIMIRNKFVCHIILKFWQTLKFDSLPFGKLLILMKMKYCYGNNFKDFPVSSSVFVVYYENFVENFFCCWILR